MMAHLISQFVPMFVILIVVVAVLGAFSGKLGGATSFRARALMTPAEVAFWRVLCEVVSPWHIAPQVSMGALLTTTGSSDRSGHQSARNKFDRKIVDFVLLDDNGQVRLLIELDDRTHVGERDAARDRMTATAGYKTLRVTGRLKRDSEALRTAVRAAL